MNPARTWKEVVVSGRPVRVDWDGGALHVEGVGAVLDPWHVARTFQGDGASVALAAGASPDFIARVTQARAAQERLTSFVSVIHQEVELMLEDLEEPRR